MERMSSHFFTLSFILLTLLSCTKKNVPNPLEEYFGKDLEVTSIENQGVFQYSSESVEDTTYKIFINFSETEFSLKDNDEAVGFVYKYAGWDHPVGGLDLAKYKRLRVVSDNRTIVTSSGGVIDFSNYEKSRAFWYDPPLLDEESNGGLIDRKYERSSIWFKVR